MEKRKMNEKCKTCKKEINSGIWLSPQFSDEMILLFCSEKCKKDYIKAKLKHIKDGYPEFYEKVKDKGAFWLDKND